MASWLIGITPAFTGPPNGIAGMIRIALRRLRCNALLGGEWSATSLSTTSAILGRRRTLNQYLQSASVRPYLVRSIADQTDLCDGMANLLTPRHAPFLDSLAQTHS